MNEATKEWVVRAEEDYRVARRESRVQDEPSYTAVSFHSQQCAEKYIKAFLQEHNIPIVKTHDLVYLLELLLPLRPLWSVYRSSLELLVSYAVDTRYPGTEVTKEEALRALSISKEIRDVIRTELGII
ncbi:MAG: HEPN domain-containing protein [Candidatus Kapaibacterium sp.]